MTKKRGPKPVDRRALKAWKKYRPASPALLAERLKVTPPAVSKWPYVPRDRLDDVAEFLGVEPRELRPDLFPPWAGL